jgi:hypothetical protein
MVAHALTARLIPSSRTMSGNTSEDITNAAGPSPTEKHYDTQSATYSFPKNVSSTKEARGDDYR